jgi:putative endonuclease
MWNGQMNHRQILGRWGENHAVKFIKERGLSVIGTNIRTSYGELDIVAIDRGQVVFIEVKTRSSNWLGEPEEAVQERKKEHLIHAAEAYMQEHEELPDDWRIDVIAITGILNDEHSEVEWFKNAVA